MARWRHSVPGLSGMLQAAAALLPPPPPSKAASPCSAFLLVRLGLPVHFGPIILPGPEKNKDDLELETYTLADYRA